jgi:GntR family transcriptional repressor for pyruvate dehydrogenase complex
MTVQLKRAQRVSLSEFVLEQLLSLIREGKLKPGERLPTEAGLSAMLGVGRSSVREAMRVLVFMGLVDSKPGRGTVIAMRPENPIPPGQEAFTLQSAAMLDLYEVRSILESGSAALATERAVPVDLAAIEQAAKAVEEQVALRRSYFHENVEFHLAIAKASHNNVLVESLRRLLGQIRGFRQRVTDPIPDLPARDVAEHRAILAAIQENSGRCAQKLMSQHIGTTIQAARLRRVGSSRSRPSTDRRSVVSGPRCRPEGSTAR